MAKRKASNRKASAPATDNTAEKENKGSKPVKPVSAGQEKTNERNAAKRSGAPQKAFPLVGVGASAGGLEAFTQLLAHLPQDTGMGFVLIQHLDPKHQSMLTEILSRSTKMPVREVMSGMHVEPDNVYVIPPGTNMSLVDGMFRLVPRTRLRGREMPIDYFLHSLAEQYRTQAIGVILSGTLSDGALGLKAIKAEGGVTFAQEERSAKFHDMPRAAIAAGSVDFILPPEGIARELAQIGSHPYVAMPKPKHEEQPLPGTTQEKIYAMLQKASGVDFRNYRQTTIKRRISRRMVLNKIDTLEQYLAFLSEKPAEVDALYEDILITVTGFFRDPEAFETLKKRVFPTLLKKRSANSPIRIWVAGCSTGEEVYSIAIALFESLSDTTINPPIQIFATDISDTAIERARTGIYLENSMVDISPERLRRFFVKVEQGYQVSKTIRDVCVFAKQNIAADPPFSSLDLLSCRNLLIYLEPALQNRIIPFFHYALKPTGFLMLGNAETIGKFGELFVPIDKHGRIYSKRAGSPRQVLDFGKRPSHPDGLKEGEAAQEPLADEVLAGLDLTRETDRLILSRYAPAGVVVNDAMEVVQFRGRVSAYLEPAPGSASFNLLKMAREGLLVELRSAILRAKKKGTRVRAEGLKVRQDGSVRRVNLEVVPIRPDTKGMRYYLILFEEVEAGRTRPVVPANAKAAERRGEREEDIARLEQELTATKDYLQSIIEEQEASNEELKSANEEILSSNEELQSTNEELETAKEELQSTNEELTTVNEELGNRNSEMTLLNSDLSNLISAINIPIVMLGVDGRVRRYTQPTEKLLNLIPTDVGRPIHDIKPNIDLPDLRETIKYVIDTVATKEVEVQDRDGKWYLLRVRPYWTMDKRVDGAVMVFLDIDPLKRSLEQVNRARDYAQTLVETVRESLVVLDDQMKVRTANHAFYKIFQTSPLQTEGRPLFELSDWSAQAAPLLALAREASSRAGFKTEELEIDFERLGRKTLFVNARRIRLPGEPAPLTLLAIEDITERKAAETELRASESSYRKLFESAREGILIVDAVSGATLDANPFLLELTGYEKSDLLGRKPWELPFAPDPEAMRIGFSELAATGFAFDPDLELRSKGGGEVHVEALSSVYYLGTQKVAQYNLRDITARKAAEGETRRQKEFTGRVVDSSLDGILAFDRDYKLIVWNLAMERIFGVRRDDALGREVFEILPFFKETGDDELLARAMSGKSVVSEDRPYATRAGRKGFFEGHYSPLRDETGRAIGCLVVIHETTSQKRFEDHLRQVQKLESLGTLSGGIAHDFNNILNIVSAYTALLARDDEKKAPTHLAAINKAVDRGAALVRHLLTFARRSDVEFKTVDINEVIEELDRLVRETFPRKLQTRMQLAKNLPAILADPNQIHQALLNLCVNARDAMPDGGTLTIKTGLTSAEDLRKKFTDVREVPYIFVSVSDTGGGIDEAARARLFEPFFTTKESGKGAGLGLALVYGIVKAHLGFVDVESQSGIGADFRIFLPVEARAENSKPRAQAAAEAVAAGAPPEEALREDASTQKGNETILFAEDEEMLSSAVKSLLESEGYKVLTVKDGQEALDLFRRRGREIAISILDLQMPRLGGWETFLKMREIDPAAKVLIASGDLGRQERIEMKNAGIEGSIRKPYSAGQVMKAVRRVLDR
jgi:two-component system CheB/CheR fusion protein